MGRVLTPLTPPRRHFADPSPHVASAGPVFAAGLPFHDAGTKTEHKAGPPR
jgi:hypothetical protein